MVSSDYEWLGADTISYALKRVAMISFGWFRVLTVDTGRYV